MTLSDALASYRPADETENAALDSIRAFLGHCGAQNKNPFCRTTLEGHVTAGAWIIDPDAETCVLVHHRKLDMWVQPGGHCDGDPDVAGAALREAREETGLKSLHLQDGIFDVDAHNIPERGKEPAHIHYDIRFLVYGDARETPFISHESRDARWIALDRVSALTGEESVLRMVRKTQGRSLQYGLRKSA